MMRQSTSSIIATGYRHVSYVQMVAHIAVSNNSNI